MKTTIGFYGDDFTGAADNAAQYHRNGLRTLLYFSRPDAAALDKAAQEFDVIGVAGTARSMATTDMGGEILPILQDFKRLGLQLIQYKCCSTLDSTAHVGSLGEAARLMRSLWPDSFVPVLGAAPEFGRYTMFGNHFAKGRDAVYRLDRHPTMSRHPVTPMTEADIRVLMHDQQFPVERLVDLPQIDAAQADPAALASTLAAETDCAVFDTYSVPQLVTAAGTILEISRKRPVTAVAAQGFAYGVGSYLQRIASQSSAAVTQYLAPVNKILVVSGSCSPQSAAQIAWSEQDGFLCLRLDAQLVLKPEQHRDALAALEAEVLTALRSERSVLVYTALGLDDPVLETTRALMEELGVGTSELANRLGALYAGLLRAAITHAGVTRVVVAGGDSSSFTMRHLGAQALAVKASNYHQNSHFCTILADDAIVNGVEVLLKGGQVGNDALYGMARDGFTLEPST